MTEREILAELERLISDLGSLKTQPSEVEERQDIEQSLGHIREFLMESRARREVLHYRTQASAEAVEPEDRATG